jgi:hypothetical protein
MRQLTVHVLGGSSDDRLLTLPFEVFGSDGELLAQGTASPMHPAVVNVQDESGEVQRVHVVGRPPVGDRVQVTLQLGDGPNLVYLPTGSPSPHEWLQWVTPFRSLSHLRLSHDSQRTTQLNRKIGRVWMTVWALQDGHWVATDMRPADEMHDKGIRQVSLDVPAGPHLLQVGGDNVAWRLVSLPPGGLVRVALTGSALKEGDSIDVTIGRERASNELIMSYLSIGATMEAQRLGDAWLAADLALYQKEQDPVSAAAGAYLLLKLKRLDERRRWVDNLVDWFPYLADGAIVAAALALQRSEADEKKVRNYLDLAVNRGPPVFALGVSILVETMAAVHRGKRESKKFHNAYRAAQAYNQARCSKGAYFAFYGRSPAEPSWARLYGAADSPQPSLLNEFVTFNLSTAGGDIGLPETAVVKLRELGVDDVLRIEHEREYRVSVPRPDAWTIVKDFVERKIRVASGGTLLPETENWSEQRQRNAFTVFDGNE